MESHLYDLGFILAFHKIVDAYSINFMDFCEVKSYHERLKTHLKPSEQRNDGHR